MVDEKTGGRVKIEKTTVENGSAVWHEHYSRTHRDHREQALLTRHRTKFRMLDNPKGDTSRKFALCGLTLRIAARRNLLTRERRPPSPNNSRTGPRFRHSLRQFQR